MRNSDRRNRVFQNFVMDNELRITDLGKPFLNTDGMEVSKLDYFLYGDSMADLSPDFFKMDSVEPLYQIITRLGVLLSAVTH